MPDYSKYFGWSRNDAEVEAVIRDTPKSYFPSLDTPIKGSGKGKTVLLYKIVEAIAGEFTVRRQAIGDCVAFGSAGAIDCLKATDIYLKNNPESWGGAITSTEDIYGGSRVQVGQGRLGSGDGSHGAWAAKYVKEYGTLLRKNYGSIDLTKYSGSRARQWGMPGQGTPQELLTIARDYTVQTVSKVTSVEDARDLIANGYPITIASNAGFQYTRNKDGISRRSGSWAHQMFLSAVDDGDGRCLFLVQNSWGVFNSGPKHLNQPDGSFWIVPEDLQYILNQGDSWVYSGFNGYKLQNLTLEDTKKLMFGQ